MENPDAWLDNVWIMNLDRQTEGVLIDNGVTSIRLLRILAETGSLLRLDGIGPSRFNEIVDALERYDDIVKQAFPLRENIDSDLHVALTIARSQDNGEVLPIYKSEYSSLVPIPRKGEIVWFRESTNRSEGYVVQTVHYLYDEKVARVLVIVGEAESEEASS